MSNQTVTLTTTNEFNPTLLGSCQFWYDGGDISPASMNLSGSNVLNWNDKSGNGRNLSRATATGPFLTSNFNGGFRTVEAISPSSGSMIVNNVPSSAMQGSTGSCFFFVFSYSSGILLAQYAEPRFLSVEDSNRYDYGPFGANVVYRLPTGRNYFNPQIFCLSLNVSNSNYTSFQTGLQLSNTIVTPITLAYTKTMAFFGSTDGSIPAFMRMSEFIGYNRFLPAGERQQVEGYLAWKWGLQASLPSTHPYSRQPVYFFSPTINQFSLPNSITLTTTNQFNPPYLGNLQLWIDGSTTANMTFSSGSLISAVLDRSGNGRNATQATVASQPTFAANIQNGLGGIQFNGTNSCLNIPDFATVPYTLFIVCRFLTTGNTGFAMNYQAGGGFSVTVRNSFSGVTSVQSIAIDFGNGSTRYMPPTAVNDTNTHMFNLAIPSGSLGTFFFDGAAGVNTAGFTQTPYTITLNTLGAFAQIPTNSTLNGYVFEVLMYNSVLPINQREQVEGYLAWKWGLQTRLPSTHPYSLQNPYFFSPTISQFTLARSITPASFSPLSIRNSVVWLDPADPGTVTLSGTTIVSIQDKSPTGALFDQGTSKPTNTTLINGLTTMNFPGGSSSTNVLGTLTSTPYDGITQFSLFVVKRPTWASGTLATSPCMFGVRSAATTTISWHNYSNYASGYISWNGVSTTTAPVPITQNELTLFEIVQGASSYTPYKIGTAFAPIAYTISSRTGLPASVGNSFVGQTEGFQGQICEVLFYSRAVTDLERQNLEGYLSWKWGLQGSLPTTHPFRNFPPAPLAIGESGPPVPVFAGWSIVLDGADASVVNNGGGSFTCNGPNDSTGAGWAYIYALFPTAGSFTYNFTWFTGDDLVYDWPFEWVTSSDPANPANVDFNTKIASANSESGSRTVSYSANQYVVLGVYSIDTVAGNGVCTFSSLPT